ncbi:MAG: PASTA domain-containing protein [Clostridia bacterium]|nr:PASTA domain-containing protein [Clostridia bacterium]
MENKKKMPMKDKIKKRKKVLKISQRRALIFLIIIVLLLCGLLIRIGKIQFIDGDYLRQREYNQSISSSVISAKRGIIYDCNKKSLAISADVDTISVNPKLIKSKNKKEVDQEETKALKENLAKEFSDIFELDYNSVLEKLNSEKELETIVSKVENDKVDELRKWLKDNNAGPGINIDKDTKRYYPYDNLASNLIGFCGTDNQGLDGVELSYDRILKGTNGKRTTSISVTQDAIPDGDEQYIAPEDGSNIYLTIDSNIQKIAEKYLKQAVEENSCSRGGNVIIEDPTTGEILAMATYPDYNLNEPYTPNSSISSGWDELATEKKSELLYSMWRNRAVLDTYEPGSTFKVITASAALEESLAKTDIAGDFYCSGKVQVSDKEISCAKESGHGSETLRQALENSCNPALIQLGQRIGVSTFYKYLRSFGLFSKTGIDLPSEGNSTFWSEKNVGPVELATMSFGQRFTITPMQLVKAVSAIANEGVMVTPHIVKKIENTNTGTITNIETVEEKQVISKTVANNMKDIMKDVVEKGGGTYAQVSGYTIGGKTGTSEPDPSHPENGYVSSFLAIAPVENTKLVVLLTLYAPHTSDYYGGKIAAPAVSQILSEVLPYLDIPSNDKSDNSNSNLLSVPNVKTKTFTEAKKIIESMGLKCDSSSQSDDVITEQVPTSGTQLTSGGIVKLYSSGHDERVSQTVPDLKGVTFERAKIMLEAKNLNISKTGSGIVIAQNPQVGATVDEGTVVSVTLQEQATKTQN